MLKLFTWRRGSITVFLSIILVPMLLFTSILVDGAALTLSKGTVESAGELTTNAILANYDTVLKDVYGLFAMSQKADDPQKALQENVQRYFEDSVRANGIIPENIDWDSDIVDRLADALNGYSIDDAALGSLVDISMDESSTIKYMDKSSLADPDILRSQIVEYSKYRAPVYAVVSAVDSLGAFKKVNEQSKVMDAKLDVDDALNDVNDELKKLYADIGVLDEQVAALEQKIYDGYTAAFSYDDVQNAMLACHSIVVNLKLEDVTIPQNNVYVKKTDGNVSYYKINGNGVSSAYTPGVWKKNQSLTDIENEFKAGKASAKKALDGTESGWNYKYGVKDYANKVLGYATFSGMDLTTWNNTSTTSNPTELENALAAYGKLSDAIVRMAKAIASIDDAKKPSYPPYPDFEEEEPQEEDYDEEEYEEAYKQYEEDKKEYEDDKKEYEKGYEDGFKEDKEELKKSLNDQIDDYVTYGNNYASAISKYLSASKSYDAKLREYLGNIYDLFKPIVQKANDIANDINISWDWFNSEMGTQTEIVLDRITKAKNYIQKLDTKLNTLEKKLDNYNKAVTGNKDTNDDYSTTISQEAKEIAEKFDATDLDEITNQVKAIKKYVCSESNPLGIIAGIDSLKIANTCVVGRKDISNRVNDIVSKYKNNNTVKTKWNEAISKGTYKDLDKNTKSVVGYSKYKDCVLYNACTKPDNMYNAFNTTQSCYLKRLAETGVKVASGGKAIGIPQFYFYLLTTFNQPKLDKKPDIEKDELESAKKKMQEKAENDNGKGKAGETWPKIDMTSYGTLPSAKAAAEKAAKSSGKNKLFQFFKEAIASVQDTFSALSNLNGSKIRDNLLVSEYIMSNFSMYSDKVNADPENPKIMYSNVEINSQNNVLYGCEIEYMLYGLKGKTDRFFIFPIKGTEKGPEINVNEAKADIFTIRLVFNSVFALTDKKLDADTIGPAMSIQAATGGVFPYQVAQVLIKLCLALAEANYDVNEIMEGKKIALMKTSKTWQFQLSNLKNLVSDTITEEATSAALNKLNESKHLALSAIQKGIDMAAESAEQLTENIKGELNSLVDASVNQCLGAVSESYTTEIEAYIQDMLTKGIKYNKNELITRCETAVDKCVSDMKLDSPEAQKMQEIAQSQLKGQLNNVITKVTDESTVAIDTMMQQMSNNIRADDFNAKEQADLLASNYRTIISQSGEFANQAIEITKTNVKGKINDIKKTVRVAVLGKVEEAFNQVEKLTEESSEKIAAEIKNQLDAHFPSATVDTKISDVTDGESSSAVNTVFVMGYEDYIRLFLIVKLMGAKSDDVIVRMADVMQINVRDGLKDYVKDGGPAHPKQKSFLMNQAYTYMEIDAKIKVDPILISTDFFENLMGDSVEYLQYRYHTVAGY